MACIVVTGGAGFLGSHLCRALLDRGDDVVAILDNFITGTVANVEELFGRSGFTLIEHDVSSYLWVPGPVDVVMHLASPASPMDYLERSRIQIAEGRRPRHAADGLGLGEGQGGRPRFLRFDGRGVRRPAGAPAARSSCWGNVDTASDLVASTTRRSGYAEAMTTAYHRHHHLDVRIVRIFNTYGPRMRPDDGRAVSNLVVQALRGEPLTIYGDGTQTRSFTYVDDQIRGFLALLDSKTTTPVNIGSPVEHTINALANWCSNSPGRGRQSCTSATRSTTPGLRRPDIAKARTELGWEPLVDLRRGLEETIAWFRSQLDV